jgi:pyrroloquinoline quinone biosynthesis protein B
MLVRLLGSAAGGGVPQWNCSCRNCVEARAGSGAVLARTQCSVAVSADDSHWVLLDASPDLRQQIAATPALQPRSTGEVRSTPIRSVVLTGADVDRVAGLLTLREGQPFTIYSSSRILGALAANPIFGAISAVERQAVMLDRAFEIGAGLTARAFMVPGKIALYLEDASAGPGLGTAEGDSLGLEVTDSATGTSFYYVPSCASVDADLRSRLKGSALVLFDGTLFDDDELIRARLMDKSGRRMGHMSMSGPEGSMTALSSLDIARRVFVHINNSNPALRRGSPECAAVVASGWEIGEDGMEIRL